jgi:RNA polymerase sigma factor (sigma-70 family)
LQFVAYVTTVLKHRLEDLRRRFLLSQKRNVYRERPIAGSQLDNESKFADGDMAVLDKLLDQEVCDRLYVALNRLPRELQRILRWRFRKEMTYQQIGEKLQRSDDDVRMLVKRCLVRLKSEVFPNGWSG